MLNTALLLLNIGITAGFAVLLWRFQKGIPNLLQTVLDDVGEQLNETFANPTIKKAYSMLANKSGEVRHDNALRNKVVGKAMDNMPLIKRIAEYFGISPVDALKLMNDPMIVPIIQGFLKKAQNSPGGFGSNSGSGKLGDLEG